MTNELLAEVSLLRNKVKKYEEAWKNVKEDIKTEIPCYDEIVPFHRGVRIGLNIANQFIDKHLKEVEK